LKLLNSLKNAALAKKEFMTFPYNTLCLKVLDLMYEEGLIQSYTVNLVNFENKQFKIYIRYNFGRSLLKNLKLISKPSNMRYLQLKDLYKIKEKKNILILSTSKGLLTSLKCKELKIGGKILFTC
jgi:small subunit ribosomal protein S8